MLCTVYDYNKTETVAGRPSVIPRFYPGRIAKMVFKLIEEVLPFDDFLLYNDDPVGAAKLRYARFMITTRPSWWLDTTSSTSRVLWSA